MGLEAYATFALVTWLLTVTPGPNSLLVASTLPRGGRPAAFASVLGIAGAFFLHGALSYFGISLLLLRSAELFLAFKLLGAGYLCWLGLRALRSAWHSRDGRTRPAAAPRRRRSLPRAFAEGFLTNALNPKVSLFYLAAFPQFLTAESASAAAAGGLVALHAAIVVAWYAGFVLAFDRLRGTVDPARLKPWIEGVSGTVFIGFGVKLLSFRP